MGEGWILIWYRENEVDEPLVKTFLKDERLRKDERAKLAERIKLLAEHGIKAVRHLPKVYRPLKGERFRKIHELRVTGTPSNPRIFFFFTDKREIVLLFGVRKVGKSTKGMQSHYKRAARLRDEWLKRREAP